MARYTGPSCRLCRREGRKLFLKGDRCISDKCALARREGAPGQHGANAVRKKTGEYGRQLREKQTARRYYGVLEKQFRKYYDMAEKMPGITGENLLSILETRFDNVVYRMGMASSRKEARQLVLHAHFRLNGKKANIPSILLKPGDVVSLKEGDRDSVKIKELVERMQTTAAPAWLEIDKENVSAKVLSVPAREDVDFDFNEQLIVELYSK
ncbi:MAG: 30S ribosomal protein S4 [Firmicutes bacterium]|nr:30S ribosomal protein S4 [Bacillota bacterium]MCD7944528.1 30S ribosomal protein S4 [Clostridia bacterium]MCD8055586.1 30S ribosomal protein S4 [Clostridiales bacterium]MCD7783073.1 30S ribosomal protein S4 [Bacillota bacterium]MCD7787805.1 30S ribosomal protein S4 [Bacillota bacterium]